MPLKAKTLNRWISQYYYFTRCSPRYETPDKASGTGRPTSPPSLAKIIITNNILLEHRPRPIIISPLFLLLRTFVTRAVTQKCESYMENHLQMLKYLCCIDFQPNDLGYRPNAKISLLL